jgi:serine/threonine protein kinase/Tfp pilus assembly protein PilF
MIETLLNNRYLITELLGEGNFGKTYLAKDRNSHNCLCLIKQLDPKQADIETAKKLFQREVEVLKSLKKEQQIPKFFNYFEQDEQCYLVEEYINGITLDKSLNRKWKQEEVIDFLRQILLILQPLHQQNIIHRDIKPTNIIQKYQEHKFVLIDFGAVKKIDDRDSSSQQQRSGTAIGSYNYAPPEQMSGNPQLNSDIYALGMTAIQLLSGIHPKNIGRDANKNIIWEEWSKPDRELDNILNKMVRFNPAERYQSVENVLYDLDRADSQNRNATNTIKEKKATESNTNLAKLINYKYAGIALLVLGILGICTELFFYPLIRPWYYSYRGDRAIEQHDPKTALEEYQKVLEIDRDSVRGWKGRGDSLFMLGRNVSALESYDRALKSEPDNLKILNNQGKVFYKLGRYQKAIAIADRVLKIDPNNAEASSGKGLDYLGLGKPKEASESFELARKSKSENPVVWLETGMAVESLQGLPAAKDFYEEALNAYDDMLEEKPKDLFSWSDRGNTLLKLNRPQEALESYQKVLDLNPNFYEALIGQANAFSGLGKYLDALLSFDRATKIRPDDYQLWFNRGMLLSQVLKNHEEAFKSFDRATKLKDDFYPAWLSKGLALMELKDFREAVAAFDRAIKIQPKDPLVWTNRGFALQKLGKTEDAQKSYSQADRLK